GFGKSGAESYHLEDFSTFSRKKPFRFFFFVILKKRKWFLLGSGLVGISVYLIPAFAKPFPVSTHPKRTTRPIINRQKQKTKMPTLRKIKRGVLPMHLPTQKHHI
ncbi:hypothetical protein, partial [Empedobacter sp. GD03739]|uniref:hypothetical protein n=1 Tax=Empedobacter sp. GD03739 TaxID=2975376 RepID=UPI002446B646